MMRRYLVACVMATIVLPLVWHTAACPANAPQLPKLIPLSQESAIALSAGPANIRDGAGVYTLEQRGYVQLRASKNGFTCIVNRDHPLSIKPTCYDREGSATILPVDLRVGELLMQGVPLDRIRTIISDGFRRGTFRSPHRPGVAYMLSNDNFNYAPSSGRQHFPPHVMFYAPNLTNNDIGSDGAFQPGMPSIAYQGPQGFMIVVMPTCSSSAGTSKQHSH